MALEVQALNGRTINMCSNMALPIMALLNSSSTLSSHQCSTKLVRHSLLHCRRRTIIQTTLHKHTNLNNLLCHSMAHSSLLSNFNLLQLLLMVTVCHLISLLMLDRHSSGQVLLSKLVPLLTIIIVVEEVSIMVVEDMRLL